MPPKSSKEPSEISLAHIGPDSEVLLVLCVEGWRECHCGSCGVLAWPATECSLLAAAQIKQRGYAAKHRRPGQEVHLVGVTFSREGRNIIGFEAERG